MIKTRSGLTALFVHIGGGGGGGGVLVSGYLADRWGIALGWIPGAAILTFLALLYLGVHRPVGPRRDPS